jgi:predicted Zn-dependent protease
MQSINILPVIVMNGSVVPAKLNAPPLSSRTRLRAWALRSLAFGLCLATALTPVAAHAQEMKGVIRDAEVENLLRDYARPIFNVAGVGATNTTIILMGDRSFNAFVAGDRRMFINTGAIMDAKTPNEIIGVIAHESGHIKGGHLSRLHQQLATAQILSVVGMLLGAGAAVGAASSGGHIGSNGSGLAGMVLGPQEIVRRSLLSYQRSEEQAADRSAVDFLNATQQSPKGLLDTFQRFSQDSIFRTSGIDPYTFSHPLPTERIANLEALASKSPYLNVKDSPALQARHDMARAKLFGFMASTAEVGRRYPLSDNSLPARYARAIVDYRTKRISEALTKIDGLIREQPQNPYFWELRGQTLLEFGRAKEAIADLRKAVSLAPSAGLIRIMLGHALVASENPALVDEAISELSNAVQREPDSPDGYRHLATAYSRKGQIGQAELNSARAYFYAGDYTAAANHASRAKDQLTPNTPAWFKADEILNYRPPKT